MQEMLSKIWSFCGLIYKSGKADLCEKEKMRKNTPQFAGNGV